MGTRALEEIPVVPVRTVRTLARMVIEVLRPGVRSCRGTEIESLRWLRFAVEGFLLALGIAVFLGVVSGLLDPGLTAEGFGSRLYFSLPAAVVFEFFLDRDRQRRKAR
jgi:hypothetical protein